MGLPATSTDPMTVTEVKNILNLTATTYDTYIANNIYEIATYANDYTNNGLAYDFTPTDTQYTSLTASSLATSSGALLMPWLVNGSVVVFSSDEAVVYSEDHDYEVDYKTGSLVYLADSTAGTSTGGYALVHFQFIYPQGGAKVAIAQLLRNSWGNDPAVVSESIGPLSRSYEYGDLPGPIKKMLNPYRKARFV